MFQQAVDFFIDMGMTAEASDLLAYVSLLSALVIVCWIAHLIARRVLLKLVTDVVQRTTNTYDDIFLERKVFRRLSHLAPAMVVSILTPILFPFEEHEQIHRTLLLISQAYVYLIAGMFASAFVSASAEAYQAYKGQSAKPMRAYVQAVKILIFLVVAILVVSTVTNQQPYYLLSGLGAVTAIILLVFKDSILGFVAGIQIEANQMARVGDWIQLPGGEADGEVIDVTLTTIKVQNWDKTVTYVPVYKLTSEAFINWRWMSESGARRIKRALQIDMRSVRRLESDEVARFQQMPQLQTFFSERKESQAPVNLTLFRAYLTAYLKTHGKLNTTFTTMVRYLPSGEYGLPLEIYAFSNTTKWTDYEGIMADLVDEILATLHTFDLRAYQSPSGEDIEQLNARLTTPSQHDHP